MDVVPCILEDDKKRILIREAMVKNQENEALAQSVSDTTVAITDDRARNYTMLSHDWLVSNPEGYAIWFESRIRLGKDYLNERAAMTKSAKIDDLPTSQWKSPLQRTIQLLKRHRDEMYKSEESKDSKPISIIITTLAARAYQGERNIESALLNVLSKMGDLVGTGKPYVPNPANPDEDFADRWSMPEYYHLRLRENFEFWLTAANRDFQLLLSKSDATFVFRQAQQKFAAALDESILHKRLGNVAGGPTIFTPKQHNVATDSKPWSM